MSLKKFMILPIVTGVLVGNVVSNNAYAVGGKCYAHKSANVKIGNVVKAASKVADGFGGGLAGLGLTWFNPNPFVKVAGATAGVAIGLKAGLAQKLGATIYRSSTKDELCTDSSGNHCLSCDNNAPVLGGGNHECEDTTVVTNGNAVYKCHASNHLGVIKNVLVKGDQWEDWTIPVCSDSPVRSAKNDGAYQFELSQTGRQVSGMPGILVFTQDVCWRITEKGCKNPDNGKFETATGAIRDPYNCTTKNVNHPHATHCAAVCEGATWKVGIKQCEKGYTLAGPVKQGNGMYARCEKDVEPAKQKTCKEGRDTPEGKACCDVPETIAKWEAPHCVCVDSDAKFDWSTGVGRCVAKNGGNGNGNNGGGDGNSNGGNGGNDGNNGGSGGNSISCNFGAGTTVIAQVSTKCANNATYKLSMQTYITQLQTQVDAGANCNVQIFNNLVAQLQTMAAECDKAPAVNQARLDSALQTISSKTSTLGTSVWKDAEGNFNKARLASDSIAGVVLGTVGGVVTGHVVKKNQIKKGFEDITCTVGGQEVGSYGDEIVVGRQQ